MTSRIGGPTPPESPRSTRGAQGADGGKFQKEMRKVEEVEKVSEAELDKQRKRAIKKPVEEEGDLEEIESRAPTPFETEFHLPTPPLGFSELDESSRASSEEGLRAMSSFNRAPSDQGMAASAMSLPPQDENLPESMRFWEGYDLPDQPPEPTQFEEKRLSKKADLSPAEKQKERLLLEEQKRKEMKTAQEKPTAMKESLPHGKKEKKPAETAPSWQKPFSKTEKKSGPFLKEQMGKQGKPLFEEQLEEMPSSIEKEEPEIPLEPKWGRMEEGTQALYPETAAASEQLRAEKEREKKKTKTETMAAVQPPEPLPPACQKVAEAALASVSAFLNAQTAELYLQMVGTMVFMSSSKGGISLTEVMLNSPAFKDSPFFGTTITIEKYATAPDSFNIRLTGSPEAVQVFSNNVANLSSAFIAAYEDRRITFRVGRIETELAPNRPLIRRKKEGGSKNLF
jgi:hypothetical protein